MRPLPTLALMLLFLPAAAVSAQDAIPQRVADLIAAFEEDAEAIRFEAERKISLERRALAKQLKVLQDEYTRAARLDEAVFVRDYIRKLSVDLIEAEPAPPNVLPFNGEVGRAFYFKVTGNRSGSLYGTDVYTGDSSIATAAVHAGVLQHGEEGIVKVRVLPSRGSYVSSVRNGITSSNWGNYSLSFSVERMPNLFVAENDKPKDSPRRPRSVEEGPPTSPDDPFGPIEPPPARDVK